MFLIGQAQDKMVWGPHRGVLLTSLCVCPHDRNGCGVDHVGLISWIKRVVWMLSACDLLIEGFAFRNIV